MIFVYGVSLLFAVAHSSTATAAIFPKREVKTIVATINGYSGRIEHVQYRFPKAFHLCTLLLHPLFGASLIPSIGAYVTDRIPIYRFIPDVKGNKIATEDLYGVMKVYHRKLKAIVKAASRAYEVPPRALKVTEANIWAQTHYAEQRTRYSTAAPYSYNRSYKYYASVYDPFLVSWMLEIEITEGPQAGTRFWVTKKE